MQETIQYAPEKKPRRRWVHAGVLIFVAVSGFLLAIMTNLAAGISVCLIATGVVGAWVFARRGAPLADEGCPSDEGFADERAGDAEDSCAVEWCEGEATCTVDGKDTADLLRQEIVVRKAMEERLLIAMEVAESANAAKSEFLANISHELRTPMTAIIASADILLQSSRSGCDREVLEIIETASKNMMVLITDLLDFAKTESGKIKLDSKVFNVRESIDAVIEPFALRAPEKGIEFSHKFDPSLPDFLMGDIERLTQILCNLLDNGIKFTKRGSVECTIENDTTNTCGLAIKSDRVCLRFSVRDTGIGVPHDKHEMIFDPFTQADGSSTRRFGGSGLGLAITRQLVEVMGGRIWLESEEGNGSTFQFVVQMEVAKTHETTRTEATAEPSLA